MCHLFPIIRDPSDLISPLYRLIPSLIHLPKKERQAQTCPHFYPVERPLHFLQFYTQMQQNVFYDLLTEAFQLNSFALQKKA